MSDDAMNKSLHHEGYEAGFQARSLRLENLTLIGHRDEVARVLRRLADNLDAGVVLYPNDRKAAPLRIDWCQTDDCKPGAEVLYEC